MSQMLTLMLVVVALPTAFFAYDMAVYVTLTVFVVLQGKSVQVVTDAFVEYDIR